MSVVVIEDQSPIMRRAKIRLGVAITLLVIAGLSLILAGKSKNPRPVAPRQKTPTLAIAPPVASAKVAKKAEVPDEAPPPSAYETLPSFQSFTAEPKPELEPSSEMVPPTVAEAPAEPLPTPRKTPTSHTETSATVDYILQVGVFADMENAEKRHENLSRHGVESRLESKLRIGPFNDTAELEAAREKLQSSGISTPLAEDPTSRGLMLRAGLFHDLASVRQLQSSVEEHGFTTRTETRVLVGPFDDKKAADTARSKIKALNIAVALMPNR